MVKLESGITNSFRPVLRIEIDKEKVMDLMNIRGLSDSEMFGVVLAEIVTKLSPSLGQKKFL